MKYETEIETLLKEYGDIEELDGCQGIEVLEWGEWVDDGKYDFRSTIIKFKDTLFCIRVGRSGSYYSDYDYTDPYIYPVKAETVTKTIYVRV